MAQLNKAFLFFNVVFIAAMIAIGTVLAWSGPSTNPPTGSGLLYYNGGNVGIGTINPAQKLSVAGTVESTTGGFKFPDGSTQTSAASSSASQWTVSGNNISNSNSGNVGIGTASPGEKLEVYQGNIKLSGTAGDLILENSGAAINFMRPSQNYIKLGGNGSLRVSPGTDGSTSYFEIDSSGKIGIGTTTPAQKLDVNGTAQMTGFKMPTGASSGYILTSDTNGVGSWVAASGVSSQWTTSGSNIYYNNGNVGIGTTVPGQKLVIEAPENSQFRIKQSSTNLRAGLNVGSGIGTLDVYTDGTGYAPLQISANPIRLNPNGEGNVGIGTASPSQQLHLVGPLDSLIYIEAPNYPLVRFRRTADGGQYFWDIGPHMDKSNAFDIRRQTATGVQDIMTLQEGGNVGIGTVSPGAKLDVAGNITASAGGRISGTGAVPSGMIAFFAGACPTGWTEYTQLRGRLIVGTPSGGTNGGTVGTALTNLQTLSHSHTYSSVISHTHSIDPPATVSGGVSANHSHSGTTDVNSGNLWDYNDGVGDAAGPGPYGVTSPQTHTHTFTTGGQSADHAHTTDISAFTSGSTGSASASTDAAGHTMPYIQLTACQAP